MIKSFKKLPGGVKFLLIVSVLYVGTGIFNSTFVKNAFVDFIGTLIKIMPILIFVFIIMVLMNLFVKPDTIKKHLGSNSGIKGWVYVIIGSIFIVGPPYILFPYLGELQKQGMRNSLIVAFMSNRTVSPVFIPVMIYYFGLLFTVVISIYIIIFSVINGVFVGKLLGNDLNDS